MVSQVDTRLHIYPTAITSFFYVDYTVEIHPLLTSQCLPKHRTGDTQREQISKGNVDDDVIQCTCKFFLVLDCA